MGNKLLIVVALLGMYAGFFAGMTVEKFRDADRITHAQQNEAQANGLEDECKAALAHK